MIEGAATKQQNVEGSIVRDVSGLAQEFGELLDVKDKERGTRSGLVEMIVQIQKSLGEPIRLARTSLGLEFPRIRSAEVVGDAVVFEGEDPGAKVSVPLARLEYDLFMDVVGEAAQRIGTVVDNRRRSHLEEIEPRLSLSLELEGGQLAIFDWRRYHLVISNAGGDAKALYVGTEWRGKSRQYGPIHVPGAYNRDVELGSVYQFENQREVVFRITCRDAEGNDYSAEAKMAFAQQGRQKLQLKPAPEGQAPPVLK